MSSRDLYQQMILDHGQSPRHFEELPDATHSAQGDNPLCGDEMTLFVRTDDDTIEEVTFTGDGCAISQASASILAGELPGMTVEEAEALAEDFKELLTGDGDVDLSAHEKLEVFEGVKDYPTRVKCATLAWHTLEGALEGRDEPVTTE
jgi:nitrogen fixation NifU-like protein